MEQFELSEGAYKCKICNFKTLHKRSAIRHTQSKLSCTGRGVPGYICSTCKTSFHRKADYERHCRKQTCQAPDDTHVRYITNLHIEMLRADRDKFVYDMCNKEFPASPFRSWIYDKIKQETLSDLDQYQVNKAIFYYLANAEGRDLGLILGKVLNCKEPSIKFFLDIVQTFYEVDTQKATKKSQQRSRKLQEMIAVLKGERNYIQELF